MSWQDVRGHYEDPPDDVDLMLEEIGRTVCEFDLSACACEKCGDATEGERCHFWPDGGHEPRDGTYLCFECSKQMFIDPKD